MRERTNSITKLVKIVATEVFEKEVDNIIANRLKRIKLTLTEEQKRFERKIENLIGAGAVREATRVYKVWATDEDKALKVEVDQAITQIAVNHGRSKNSVLCRIRDKEVIECLFQNAL